MDSRRFIEKIQDLPTISSVANQINLEEKKKSLTAKSLSAIIAKDPALTAKVLKLANSAYYGLAKQVGTLERAVTVLGFNTIRSLTLTISVYKVFKPVKGGAFDIKGLWYHSLGCAVAAKNLVLTANNDQDLAETAFLSGILHDIGKIAIAHNLPEEMAHILGLVADMHSPQHEVEKEALGFTHQKIGGSLAESWNFPASYVQAIKHHHGPFPAKIDDDQMNAVVIRSVYIANQLTKVLKLGNSTDPATTKIPVEVWTALGVSRQALPGLRDKTVADYEKLLETWKLED